MSEHRSKPQRHLFRKAALLVVVPATAFGCALGMSLLGIPVTGFEKSDAVAAKKQAPAASPYSVSVKSTPAQAALSATLDKADTVWKKQGSRIDAAGLPHPLSCVKPSPGLSLSQLYDVPQRGSAQVTIASYAAGVGADAFSRLVNTANDCKNANVSLLNIPQTTIGAEAQRLQATWSGNNITTVMWRRGDVIAFVATAARNSANATSIAESVDSALSENLSACLVTDSTVDDSKRNAVYAKKDFTGKRSTKDVTNEKTPKPELTSEQIAQGVRRIARGKEKEVPDVARPQKPVAYPVWPELPKAMETPVMPDVPEPQKLKASVNIRVADPSGPGCGWNFMASAVAPYDEAQVKARNDMRTTKAQAELDQDAQRWRDQTQAYYSAYAEYSKDVTDFRAYASAVAGVAVAWSDIAKEWADYYAAYDRWERFEASRDQFIADMKDAQTGYDDDLVVCDELAVSLDPADIATYADTCPPVRPEILDEDVPDSKKEPKKPKDPRP